MILFLFSCLGCPRPVVATQIVDAWDPNNGLRPRTEGDERPLGPMPDDQLLFDTFLAVQNDGALGSSRAAQEIADKQRLASQTMLASIAGEEFSAGLVYGNVALAELACDSIAEVTEDSLHRVGGLEALGVACALLDRDLNASTDPSCADARTLARRGWDLLGAGNEIAARAAVGSAMSRWRTCPDSHAIRTAPAEPNSLGFVTVVIGQILELDEQHWLRGHVTPPNFADRIDARWRRAVPAAHTASSY